MTIDAHILVNDKFHSTIQLSDDPREIELIKALGGNDTDGAAYTFGRIEDWEVLYIASNPTKKLVIGAAPYISAAVQARKTCTLTPKQAENLVSGIKYLWQLFGVNEQD